MHQNAVEGQLPAYAYTTQLWGFPEKNHLSLRACARFCLETPLKANYDSWREVFNKRKVARVVVVVVVVVMPTASEVLKGIKRVFVWFIAPTRPIILLKE